MSLLILNTQNRRFITAPLLNHAEFNHALWIFALVQLSHETPKHFEQRPCHRKMFPAMKGAPSRAFNVALTLDEKLPVIQKPVAIPFAESKF